MQLSEDILLQIVIIIGGVVSSTIAAFVGYIIWSWKNKKKLEEQKRLDDQKRSDERTEDQKLLFEKLQGIENKVDNLQHFQSINAEALSLVFESDMIQFQAFRKSGLLNGESERQEEKLKHFMNNKITNFLTPKETK